MKKLWKLFFFICISTALSHASAGSKEDLFGDIPGDSPTVGTSEAKQRVVEPSSWTGTLRAKTAYMFGEPTHWSNAGLEADVSARGRLSDTVKWKLGFRTGVDAAYLGDHYPEAVRRDNRAWFDLRENYLDIEQGEWSLRFGRQHIVWGELVGLFLADVVSARSYDRFEPTDLSQTRIPQWAVRVERNWGNVHADFVWIPVPSYDKIGHPGSDFYPGLSVPATYRDEKIPERNLGNTNYGARISALVDGWDVSVFAYHSMDVTPTFRRVSPLGQPLEFEVEHGKINQFGGTVTKDLGADFMLKAESVYTSGRRFSTRDPSAAQSLVASDTFDYALGVDHSIGDTRVTLQFMQRRYLSYEPQMLARHTENTVSALLTNDLTPKITAQLLVMYGLDRHDSVIRPQVSWKAMKDLSITGGVDIFSGSKEGMFGRYGNNDRAFLEGRMSF